MAALGRHFRRLLLVVLCLVFASGRAWATPTGLNNIPTTDVVPKDILVLQTWAVLADDAEVGLDWKANHDPHGHVAFQAKYAFGLGDDAWKGVIGIANVSGETQHQGHVFPYAATSYDLEAFRLHLGYTTQHDNEGVFAGADKTVSFLDRDLTLRADAIQVNRRDDILYSAGFLYDLRPPGGEIRPGLKGAWDKLTKNLLLESWVTAPSTGSASLTLKLNYVIEF
jgi:hypothetical protein